MMQRNAPAVHYPVGRTARLKAWLVGLWLLGAALIGARLALGPVTGSPRTDR